MNRRVVKEGHKRGLSLAEYLQRCDKDSAGAYFYKSAHGSKYILMKWDGNKIERKGLRNVSYVN